MSLVLASIWHLLVNFMIEKNKAHSPQLVHFPLSFSRTVSSWAGWCLAKGLSGVIDGNSWF